MAVEKPSDAVPDILMIDNYDSFTWNVYQYLCSLGANVTVIRSQEMSLEDLVSKYQPSHLVISPGPGHPLKDSGISIDCIHHYAGKIPILGVCMGLQCIYAAYGGVVDGAGEIIHGKTSLLDHDSRGLFTGLGQGIKATRYHSLASSLASLPECLQVTSRTRPGDGQKGGVVMGIRHKTYTIEGVQYHPESIMSEEGKLLLKNFLNLRTGLWENSGLNGAAAKLPTILNVIVAQRKVDVQTAKNTPGLFPAELQSRLSLNLAPPVIDLYKRLQYGSSSGDPENPSVALMAEIKRASPSKGDIVQPNTPFSSAHVGLSYALAGASVISVLTEPKWFKGSLEDMRLVRAAISDLPHRPAVLRKDFVLDTYQIDEARLCGADTILLIVAMLEDKQLKKLFDHSRSLGMEPLVEVNNAEEMDRALALGAKVIGVNNRNLHDFNVDMSTTSRLAHITKDTKDGKDPVILCALSGISTQDDVKKYSAEGVRAVLVGEALMRAKDKMAFAQMLLGKQATSDDSQSKNKPFVKICGVKNAQVAVEAANEGADMLGLMFVRKSKRYVSVEEAEKIISAVKEKCTVKKPAKLLEKNATSSDWFSIQSKRLENARRPLFVGVFQDNTLEDVISTVQQLSLDVVQFHGSEPMEWSHQVGVPVIRAFSFPSSADGEVKTAEEKLSQGVKLSCKSGYHSMPLFDTATDASSGGTGTAFDWSLASIVANIPRGEGLGQLPFMLAGGLTPSNVKEAITVTGAWGVDVSGGVETAGEKDIEKVVAFIKAAKS